MSIYQPEELVTEILCRVHVKHLVKFLVVSKPWYAMITRPNFRDAHLNRIRQQKMWSNSSPLFIRGYTHPDKKKHYVVYSDDEEESVTELGFPLKSQIGYMRVVGRCDGLICLSDYMLTTRHPIHLWNPSARKYIELPSPIIHRHSPHMFVLGFGTDRRGDYKVVRIVFHKNGSLHWISYSHRRNRDGSPPSSLLLCFDLEIEVFTEMMLPDDMCCLPVADLAVNVCQGNLAVMAKHRVEGHSSCSIWVMKQYGVFESWTRLFAVDLVGMMDRVVGFHRGGNVFLAKEAGELVVLDPISNKSQELGVLGSTRSFYVCDFEVTNFTWKARCKC